MSKNTLEIIAKVRSWMKGQDTMVGKRAIALARFVDRFKVEEYLDELEAAYKSENHCEKRYDKDGDEMPPHCAFDDLKIDRLKGKVQELEALTGNVAKLREALEVVLDECCHHLCAIPDQLAEGGQTCDWRCVMPGRCEAIDKAKAAISAPPRNCDVGTVEEQKARMADWCHRTHCGDCPACTEWCAISWANLPYDAAQKGDE